MHDGIKIGKYFTKNLDISIFSENKKCYRKVWRYQKGYQKTKSKKDIQYNGQKKNDKKDKQLYTKNTSQKTQDLAIWTPLKTRDKLGCSERVNSSCSTCGTHHKPVVIIHEWGKHRSVNTTNRCRIVFLTPKKLTPGSMPYNILTTVSNFSHITLNAIKVDWIPSFLLIEWVHYTMIKGLKNFAFAIFRMLSNFLPTYMYLHRQ